MSKQTDEQVMMEVKESRVELLAILFERHHLKLYNFLLRLTGKPAISEDLVQEVFCRILKYRGTYEVKYKFTFWMYKISRNVFLDYLRKTTPEYSLDEMWIEGEAPEPGPAEMLSRDQDQQLLYQALSALPLKKREVIMLSRFQNMKYQDIAKILDCSIESVKVLVHRGIKDLRKNFFELKGGSI